MHRSLLVSLVVGVLVAPAWAQQCGSYHAPQGSLPTEQGWEQNDADPFTAEIVDGRLRYSTLPFSDGSCQGPSQTQYVNWRLPDIGEDISFDDDTAFEARVLIESSQYGRNGCEDWPRPGFLMVVSDEFGHRFWIGLGSSRVFLANDSYVPFGDPGVVEANFDTTDGFHTYRLAIVGTGATLFVDDQALLSLSSLGRANVTPNVVAIGDSTVWANAAAQIEWFRFTSGTCCTADIDGSGAVDFDDLLAILAAWGPCEGACPEDLDGSGGVDFGDILAVLTGWGPCA